MIDRLRRFGALSRWSLLLGIIIAVLVYGKFGPFSGLTIFLSWWATAIVCWLVCETAAKALEHLSAIEALQRETNAILLGKSDAQRPVQPDRVEPSFRRDDIRGRMMPG